MPRPASGDPATAGCLVAIVDDEPLVRSAASSLLRALGFECRMFGSAEDLIEDGTDSFACVLSDIQMPGMSGVALAQHIAQTGSPPPVLLMSAYRNEQAQMLCHKGVVAGLLEKPLDGELLQGLIGEAMIRRNRAG